MTTRKKMMTKKKLRIMKEMRIPESSLMESWRVPLASPVKLPTYNRVKPKDYDSVSETGSGMWIAPILRKYLR